MLFGIPGLIAGIILVVLGFFLTFLFPTTTVHQGEEFGAVGVILGIILLIIGGALIFL